MPVETRPCRCGCGERTKNIWRPGHDSKVLHRIVRHCGDVYALAEREGIDPADWDWNRGSILGAVVRKRGSVEKLAAHYGF